jgi:hypothetical protein
VNAQLRAALKALKSGGTITLANGNTIAVGKPRHVRGQTPPPVTFVHEPIRGEGCRVIVCWQGPEWELP